MISVGNRGLSMSRVGADFRLALSWLVAVGLLGSVLVGVPLVRPLPVGAAVGDVCDGDGDGVDGGTERDVVSNGDDVDALNYRDAFGDSLAALDDPERWLFTVCAEGDEWQLLSGPTRGLHPDAGDWQDDARLAAVAALVEAIPRPGVRLAPHTEGLQTVNLESWLAVDPEVYEPAYSRIVRSEEVSGVSVEVTAEVVGADFEFSDGVSVFCPVDVNVLYDEALLPDVPCGREWEEPSERGEIELEVTLRYEASWVSSLGDVSPAPFTVSGRSRPSSSLEVTEIQAFLSEDGTQVPAVGEFDDPSSLFEGESDCFAFLFIPTAACAANFVLQQVLDALPAVAREALETALDFLSGCAKYGIDAVGDVVASIGQVKDLLTDTETFVNEKLATAQELYSAVRSDPEAFFSEMGGEVFKEVLQTKLYNENKAKWAGYMGCQIAVSVLTGGGALSKLALKAREIFDSKFPDVDLPKRKPGDDDDGVDGPTCRINSFPAGTPVLMADGSHVPIELVVPGDRVLTYNTGSGVWSGNQVLDQWSGVHTREMVTVTLTDGSSVQSTDDHLFWVSSATGEWVEADQLEAGDLLLTPDGVTPVVAVTVHAPEPLVVWELDTAEDDTFAVKAGSVDLLVHNATCHADGDGTVTTINDDGTKVRERSDGSTEYVNADGARTDADGKVLEGRNGPYYDTYELRQQAVDSGALVKNADGSYTSAGGLKYDTFDPDQNMLDRVDHVLQHADGFDKPGKRSPHSTWGSGVDPIAAIDEAWSKAVPGAVQSNGNQLYSATLENGTQVRLIVKAGSSPPSVVTAFPLG